MLGVDRSGTSLVSEILYKWGAYPGELDHLAEANEANPQGFWEYVPMEDFIHKLFSSVNVTPWDPTFNTLMKEKASDWAFRKEALEMLEQMEKGPAWFWKEPYLSLCMGFWEEILEDPIFIVTIRNPYESARSFEKYILPPNLRGKISLLGLFLLRWQWFMLSILKSVENSRSVHFIPYDSLVRHPIEQCDRLARFLDQECGTENVDREKLRRMKSSVNPGLYRNRSSVAFADAPNVTPMQVALYEYLLRKADNPLEPFDPALYPIPDWALEYLVNFDVFSEMFNLA